MSQQLATMMVDTTRKGTAKQSFYTKRGRRRLPFYVAGKTGTLAYRGQDGDPLLPNGAPPPDGHLMYSWFIGFAPATKPEVAFSVVLGNPARWRVKAATVAELMLDTWADQTGRKKRKRRKAPQKRPHVPRYVPRYVPRSPETSRNWQPNG